MAEMGLAKKILIFATLVIYVIHLVFNGISNIKGQLFPNTTAEISQEFPLPITPAGATFAIWGVIFIYQVIWLIYCVTTVFRKGDSTNILSANFYVFFIINISLIVVWLLVWSRSNIVGSLIVIILAQLFLEAALTTSVLDLHRFLSDKPGRSENVDTWCQRLLVQNGLAFYATWTTIATLINAATVMTYKLGASSTTASLIVLSILLLVVVVWFVLENSIFAKYVPVLISEYPVIIVAGVGILARNWSVNATTSRFVLAILIIAAMFLVVRIVVIAVRAKRRNVGTNGETYGLIKA